MVESLDAIRRIRTILEISNEDIIIMISPRIFNLGGRAILAIIVIIHIIEIIEA